MAAPTAEEIKELWSVHLGPEATAERERRANAFDDTRSWVDPNGYRLSDRVWRQRAEIRSQVDQVLRQAIRTGEDALLTAKKLEQYLDPAYAPVRTEKGRLKRNQSRSIVTTAPGRGGSGSFSARRLSRTEITRAHGQATIWTAERTPFAKGVKWNISGRHPKADGCDENANRDSGLGRGVYKTSEVPRYPSHPQDLCNLSVATEEDTDKIVKQLREQYGLDEVTAQSEIQQQLADRGVTVQLGTLSPDGQTLIRVPSKEQADKWMHAYDGAIKKYEGYGIPSDIKLTDLDGKQSMFSQGKLVIYDGDDDDDRMASNFGIHTLRINTNAAARKGYQVIFESAEDGVRYDTKLPSYAMRNEEDVVIHELGHRLNNGLTKTEQKTWNKAATNRDLFATDYPSSYGTENSGETWAEGMTRKVGSYPGTWSGPMSELQDELIAKLIKRGT